MDADYDLVFAFPLPHVTSDGFLPAVGQQAFERQLRRKQTHVADLLGHAFEQALVGDQSEVLRSVLHKFKPLVKNEHDGAHREPVTDEGFLAPLLQGGKDATEKCDPNYSFGRAQECTILLFIAILKTISSFCQEELKKMGDGSDPGMQVTIHDFPGTHGRKLYVCCSLSTPAAELLAEIDEYPVQLSRHGIACLGLEMQDADHSPSYVSYSREHRDYYHKTVLKEDAVLRPIDVIRIFRDKITDLVDLSLLKQHGLLCEDYPLHVHEELLQLQKTFHVGYIILWPSHWNCIGLIRRSFGEEVALYFCFLRELSAALAGLSLFAIFTMIWKSARCDNVPEEGQDCAETTPTCVFAAVLIVWFRIFTLRWYQRESHCSAKWGVSAQSSCRLKQSLNPRIQCRFVPDPVYGTRRIRKAPAWLQALGIACSTVLTIVFLSVLLALVAAEHLGYHLLATRAWENPNVPHYLTMAFGVVTGIQIKVVDGLWNAVSDWITDFEYRWTEQGFLGSKRLKSTIVKFITGVCTMLYLAIVAATVEETSEFQLYAQRLATQLRTLFFTRYIVLGSFNRLAKPYLQLRFKLWWRSDGKRQMTFTEVQELMEEYTEAEHNGDFMDVLVPLSLVLFFGIISPMVVLLMLLLVIVQFRSDIWKLVHTYRRPFPRAVKSNLVFDDFMEFCGISMIFMNLAMISVIARREASWRTETYDARLAAPHFSAAMVGLLLWHFLAWLVPSKTERTQLQEERQLVERHKLDHLRQPVAVPAKLDVAVACPTGCPDFATRLVPKPRSCRRIECKKSFTQVEAVQ
mmetsp:Transcript_128004/g.255613  ORF Transcript_128004/g.255613 Transcript_128004/m.255613 type:complete len:802 (-) Transcript_128004:70-2475(-)